MDKVCLPSGSQGRASRALESLPRVPQGRQLGPCHLHTSHVARSFFLPPAQVVAVTGCVPGAVPPFGSAWGLKTYVDASLKKQVIVPLQVESSQT